MAKRPIFIPGKDPQELVRELPLEFEWHPGFSLSQKEKSIRSLHQAAASAGFRKVLEISTKSSLVLGKDLSAFNLVYQAGNLKMCVESAFQGSKVFETGGPFTDIYSLPGHDAKKDDRLRSSGKLIRFSLLGDDWPPEPKTAFYDWIYLNAVAQNPALADEIIQFDGFSDIEFNPKKSFNCQARSAALYVALKRMGLLAEALSSKKCYLQIISPQSEHSATQTRLPGI